jgi:hypothetical protein
LYILTFTFLTAGERTKGSTPYGSMHYQNSISYLWVYINQNLQHTNTSKNAVFWNVTPCCSCKLGTTLAIISKWRSCDVPLKCWLLQEPHGVTSQKMTFFIVTAMKIFT